MTRPRSRLRRLASRPLGLALAGALLSALVWLSPAGGFESGAGLRFLYALRGAVAPPQDVVIVAVDSASARKLGLPERPDRWPRAVHARLVAALAQGGAAVIGFDLLFHQPRDDGGDSALAAALRHAGNVVLAESIGREPVTSAAGQVVATTDRRVVPLPLFAAAALSTAPSVLPKTPDGVFEFWTVVPAAGDQPSLALVLAERVRAARGAAGAPAAADFLHPPRRVLNLYGPLGTVRTIPYDQALGLVAAPRAARAAFGGKAVLVGYSESNQSKQGDAYRTPFSTADGLDISGVELAATAVANLLDGSWLRLPPPAARFVLVVAFGALLALPWAFARPRFALPATLTLAAGYAVGAHLAFSQAFVWLPVVVPLGFSPAIAVGLGLAAHYRGSRRAQAELEQAVDLGLPRQAVERLSALLGDLSSGKTVFGVCLCSDIEGYSTLSEKLSPEATRDVLNRYFARFIPVIERHGGYAADMVGDCVMSVWIADGEHDAAFRGACDAALELDDVMNAAAVEGALRTRFGLHCGDVFFGRLGPDERHELRIVGDIVNTTSRIQGANKYLGTTVLASGEVAARVAPAIWRPLGTFCVIGKARVLDLVQLSRQLAPESAQQHFELGLKAFRAGDFEAAARRFAAAEAIGDDGPTAFYMAQCERLATLPPNPAWQGVVALPGK